MLCVTLKGYTRSCAPLSGGISDIIVFDPDDLDFTQAAPVSGVNQPYTAVTARAGATGDLVHAISFVRDEAEWQWAQSVKGCSVKYEHKFIFQLAENSQAQTTFLEALDAAACCCGLGMIIRLNSGKVFIAGEKYVGGSAISRFTINQNGSNGTSGKLYDDFNGGTLTLVGPYSRNLYEYTGAWSTIEALNAVV